MHNLMWLVRAARWVRNPPSAKMVMMVFGIIAVGLIIAGVEMLGYWPEWATMERQPRFPR
ncbi:hypothetical protein PANO111632_05255 [Paracoccus nototheniae]|uniref:Uncharacterized protein n=1 Tax=Paracoccus nototheniae TaxID=2489002 RepID=A0ABW4DVJ3_9RHOB|nr:hypothetical protein [Paracoccus nototheniae]